MPEITVKPVYTHLFDFFEREGVLPEELGVYVARSDYEDFLFIIVKAKGLINRIMCKHDKIAQISDTEDKVVIFDTEWKDDIIQAIEKYEEYKGVTVEVIVLEKV